MIESPLLQNIAGYVAGRWIPSRSGATLKVINPATGEHLADVPDMGAADTTAAVESAGAALSPMPSLEQRVAWLGAIVELLRANRAELARIITLEQGKPLKESLDEVDYAAGFFRFFEGNLEHLRPRHSHERMRGVQWTVHHRPTGVAGLITPWNFPLAMLAKKLSAAIGAGCPVVSKPAELTPLTCIALWNLLQRLELPPGRVNLVVAANPEPIGDVLCTHPSVRLISFTGSTEVGRVLIARSAPHVKRLALELGGNAPYVVMDDSDVNAAADALMANKFRCAGQTCVCANRVYVQEGVAPAFTEAVAQRVKKLKVGNGLEPGTDIGPLINRAAFEKVKRHVQDALARGARLIVGDANPKTPSAAWGNFFPPTVLDGAAPGMLLSHEETFGPVVAIQQFATEDEALALANGTPFGLAAYLFTRDQERSSRMIAQLQFGHVGLNTGTGPSPEFPFGGMKQSGFGREGGLEGLMEYTETQTVPGA